MSAIQLHEPSIPSNPQNLNSALLIQVNLLAQIGRRTVRIIAQRVTDGLLRHKDQELVVRHRQPELLVDVIVGLGGLVASPAGTMEGFTRVDTRGRHIAAILPADRIAGPALGRRRVGKGQSGCREDGQGGGEMHDEVGMDRESSVIS